MKTLYFECASGISGDMTAAALLDLGADRAALERAVASLPLAGFRTEITRVKKSGISCLDFNVILDEAHENHDHDMAYLYGSIEEHDHDGHGHDAGHHAHHEHRSYADIRRILAETDMTDSARALAEKIFRILAEAEAEAHSLPLSEVHFHEVGAVDSIVDVVACAVLMDSLHVDAVAVPPLAEGTGMIRCQHGILPVPVPAVLNIAKRRNLRLHIHQDWQGERVTPTGAAFLAAVKTGDQIPENADITAVGYGAGKRDYEPAGILRAILFESEEKTARSGEGGMKDVIWCLETNIDDCTGEQLGYCMEKVFEAGARDAHYEPCFMKKNRPAWILRVLCTEDKREAVEHVIFRETTTIGIRRWKVERSCLDRRVFSVNVRGEDVRIKAAKGPDGWKMKPEYEDAARLARKYGLSFAEASREILREAEMAEGRDKSSAQAMEKTTAAEQAMKKKADGEKSPAQADGEDTGSRTGHEEESGRRQELCAGGWRRHRQLSRS